jgi:hypothetical protein
LKKKKNLNIPKLLLHFPKFRSRHPSHQPISVADLGKHNSRQTFDINVPAECAFLNFALRGSAARQPPFHMDAPIAKIIG